MRRLFDLNQYLDLRAKNKGNRFDKGDHLRLFYEANPVSFFIEQTGGIASTGRERIMETCPTDLHQRAPAIVGTKTEVHDYHIEFNAKN